MGSTAAYRSRVHVHVAPQPSRNRVACSMHWSVIVLVLCTSSRECANSRKPAMLSFAVANLSPAAGRVHDILGQAAGLPPLAGTARASHSESNARASRGFSEPVSGMGPHGESASREASNSLGGGPAKGMFIASLRLCVRVPMITESALKD